MEGAAGKVISGSLSQLQPAKTRQKLNDETKKKNSRTCGEGSWSCPHWNLSLGISEVKL